MLNNPETQNNQTMNTFPLTNDQQKIEELLKPRVEVENKWPGCWLGVGDILTKEGNFYYLKSEARGGKMYVQNVEPFPYLMRPLQWWEKRSVEEMPGFVRDQYEQVWNVGEWDMSGSGPKAYLLKSGTYCHAEKLMPATYAEYTAYINSKAK